MINNIVKGILPISYDKVKVPSQKFTQSQFIKSDLRGFNAKIGSITNNSSALFGMLPIFKGDTERENIIKERIRILRKLIGNSIDAAKGVEFIPFPSEWKREEKLLETDSEETKVRKRRANSMKIKKKPYFMIYIYPELRKQYSQYKQSNNFVCQLKFGMKLKDLIEKKDKTDEEVKFLSRYNYFSPVLNTNCIMNMLCKSVEDVDFNFKYFKSNEEFDYRIYQAKEPFCEGVMEQVEKVMKIFSHTYSTISRKIREEGSDLKRYGGNCYLNLKKASEILFKDTLKHLMEIMNNKRAMVNYVIEYAYRKKGNLFKNFLWSVFGKEMVENLRGDKESVQIPVMANEEDAEEQIFGMNVKLATVFKKEEVSLEDEDFEGFEDIEEVENFDEEFLGNEELEGGEKWKL